MLTSWLLNWLILSVSVFIVTRILPPCASKGSRQYPGKRESVEQVIVANADRVIVIISTRLPDLNFRFLDRFLILAENGGMEKSPSL